MSTPVQVRDLFFIYKFLDSTEIYLVFILMIFKKIPKKQNLYLVTWLVIIVCPCRCHCSPSLHDQCFRNYTHFAADTIPLFDFSLF